MYLLKRNFFFKNFSRVILNNERSFCSSKKDFNNEFKAKSEADSSTKSTDKSPTRQLTSAVVIKNNENLVKDQNVDYNIAIKNLDKYDDEKQIVYDITDEQLEQDDDENKFKYLYQNRQSKQLLLKDPKLTERGKEGVFDIDQMVYALQKEKINDIAVIRIPEDILINKVFVIGSAKSSKHLASVFEYIIKLYKIKKLEKDKFPHYEGLNSKSWKIIDTNNIMLHLFLEEKREFYDIEQLWTVGAEFDDKCRIKKDKIEEMVEEHVKILEQNQQKQ